MLGDIQMLSVSVGIEQWLEAEPQFRYFPVVPYSG